MDIPCHQIDAFTRRAFAGNPAAVCPLAAWLPEGVMQQIAAENAVSETAFFVRRGDDFDLRWFTPVVEIELCGHATLASAFLLMTQLEPSRTRVRFHSKSGPLDVTRDGDAFTLDFPARPPAPAVPPPDLARALGLEGAQVLLARDHVFVVESAEEVVGLRPDLSAIAAVPGVFAAIVTGPGTGAHGDVDFVSRFFAPAKGVPEDPVTGSAHCTLTPYWAARLGRARLRARQVGRRGGDLVCELAGDRVRMTGHAVLVRTGTLHLPPAGDDTSP